MLSNTHFMKPFKLIILAGFLFALVAVTGLAQGTSPKSKNQKSETKVESTKEKVESDESRKGPSSTGLKRLSELLRDYLSTGHLPDRQPNRCHEDERD